MIDAKIQQEGRELLFEELAKLDATIQANALVGLKRGLQMAVSIVQRDFLSGPRPTKLDAVTGRLRNSITSIVEIDGNQVIGTLGSEAPYAAFHEYGFHGVEQVRGFERRLSRLATTRGGFVGREQTHVAGRSAGTVLVRPHQRRVDYNGRPFIAPGLEKAMPLIMAEIQKEL
ncbi:HK97 gp10 family phage protein [Pedosphaera parvula]|uniref:Phage virion morphogenesis protein n=1 Tax=Pedosphaera parvula (strain Ellin514) TaxID=320771 RepID=B9XDF1_PEDPL|nr:HK97 gp10 family phage protein [Pedosphaera parvula]EEF62097.1 hypothetical protein Cflav_PD6372 [Pedosphaera parvula Ellin514]